MATLTDRVTGERFALDTAPLHAIAAFIRQDWKNVNFAAKPYLDAMDSLTDMADMYGYDRADNVVRYFLGNAGSWRGENARAVKAALKARL